LPYHDLPTYSDLVTTGKIDVLNYKNRPNVVGRLKGSGGGRSLILNGHVDTITIEPKEKWTVDPFGAEIKDKKMYGRGTTDDKGGVAAAIAAVECLMAAGVRLRGDVIIESVVNEEHSGNGALACVARGIIADAVIVVEPTEFEVLVSGGGSLYWQVNVKGAPTHTGGRWVGGKKVGVSAVEKIPEVIKSLIELEDEFNKAAPHSHDRAPSPFSLTMGKISGGTYETLTAKECTIKGSLYFAESVGTVKQVIELMKGAIAKASDKDPWFKQNPPELVFLHHRNPSGVNLKEPIIDVIGKAGEKALGLKPVPMGGYMPADQGFYINQAKIPAVVFGPGHMAQAHQIDEYIRIEDYIDGVKTLAFTIYDWCK
jgi:acetylornithine deacetylase